MRKNNISISLRSPHPLITHLLLTILILFFQTNCQIYQVHSAGQAPFRAPLISSSSPLLQSTYYNNYTRPVNYQTSNSYNQLFNPNFQSNSSIQPFEQSINGNRGSIVIRPASSGVNQFSRNNLGGNTRGFSRLHLGTDLVNINRRQVGPVVLAPPTNSGGSSGQIVNNNQNLLISNQPGFVQNQNPNVNFVQTQTIQNVTPTFQNTGSFPNSQVRFFDFEK